MMLTTKIISEPPPGIEPGTYALRVRCSTPELRRRNPITLIDINFLVYLRLIAGQISPFLGKVPNIKYSLTMPSTHKEPRRYAV